MAWKALTWRRVANEITGKLECAKCGSVNIVAPYSASEDDSVACDSCGERLATIKQLQEHIADYVCERISKGLKTRLERMKTISRG